MDSARALTVKDQNGKIQTAGAAMGTFDNIAHAPDIISLLFVQNGVDLSNMSASSQNVADALTFYTSFAQEGQNVWDNTLDNSELAFAKGNVAMYFGYSWDIFAIKAINPQLQFAIYPVPTLQDRDMTIASYWINGISPRSKHPKQALLFLKYLSQKGTEQNLYTQEAKTRLFGQPYARVDLANLLSNNALIHPFVLQAPRAVSSFFASDTFDNGLNQQMNTYLGNAVNAIFQSSSAQSSAETLSKGVAQVLSTYGQH